MLSVWDLDKNWKGRHLLREDEVNKLLGPRARIAKELLLEPLEEVDCRCCERDGGTAGL